MLREKMHSYLGSESGFRYRGTEPGRLENFSDAAFALAITMLLISQEPPTNLDEVKRFTYDLFPFLACIALIMLIWHEHYVFFIRYGLRNGRMIALNTLFIVIVIFYVYPLKFLAKFVTFWPIVLITGDEILAKEVKSMIHAWDVWQLMIIYGIGAASVFVLLGMMYRYAYSQADVLELTETEKFDTRISMQSNFLMASIPVLSAILAFIFRKSLAAGPIAGFFYLMYTPVMFRFHTIAKRNREKLISQQSEAKGENEKLKNN